MKKQSDSNDAQTPYDDEATEVFAAEGPLDETVGIDERVDLTSTTQMPAADATAPVDMNAPLYAQFAGDTDADSGLGNDGGSDDGGANASSAEPGGEPVGDDLTIPMQTTDASHQASTGEGAPRNIPLYQAPPQCKPEPERPKGASAGTIVFGVVVLLSGDAAAFLGVNALGTILTVLVKGTLAGLLSGLAYKALENKNRTLAVAVAAVVCPVVNTGVFLIGCLLFFMETIGGWADAMGFGANVGQYMIVGLVGANFIFELLFNVVLSPVVVRLIRIGKKEV